MKKLSFVFQLALLMCLPLLAGSAELFPGVTNGKPLIDSLRKYYKPSRVMNYDRARDTLYGVIDCINGDSLVDVYTGLVIHGKGSQDPTTWATNNAINCEHTWCQSYFTAQTPDPVGDLQHLYPVWDVANSTRNNNPFYEIDDDITETWLYHGAQYYSKPVSNIDAYSEYANSTFEPREAQKGPTARSMFYVLTMYQLADTAGLSWWTEQKNTLREWHHLHPPTVAESLRTQRAAAYQSGKVNPFIIDSTLVDRCYFPQYSSTRVQFVSASATRNEGDGSYNLAVRITNPTSNPCTVKVYLTGGTGSAADINGYATRKLTFPAGSSADQVDTLTITDDALLEGTETLVFKLRNAGGGASAFVGADSVFTLTLADNEDVIAPVIAQQPSLSNLTSSTVTVSWRTNEPANSWVYFGPSTTYADTVRGALFDTSHVINLTGLSPGTLYHCKISSTDPANNGPTFSNDTSFTTTDSGVVALTAGDSAQQYFTIGVAGIAQLPVGWRADKQANVRTVGDFTYAVSQTEYSEGDSMPASATNGIYNYGAGDPASAPDRAIGFLSSSSATKSGNLYAHLKNTGSSNIGSLTISYDVEKYRRGKNSAGYSFQLYYSPDGIAWTTAGSNFLTSKAADDTTLGYANCPGDTDSVRAQTIDQIIEGGHEFYLAWNYSVTSGATTSNAQALGIDNVTIRADTLTTAPTIYVSASLTDFGTLSVDDSSSSQSYTISAINLTADITVTAPADFQVSLDNITFSGLVTIIQSGGMVDPTTVYVRFQPGSAGIKNQSVANASAGAAVRNVAVSGTAVAGSITPSVTSLPNFGIARVNQTSTSQSYTVSAGNLTDSLVIKAPAHFKVSLDNSTFSDSVKIAPVGGVISSATIYALFAPTTSGNKSGTITHASPNAGTKTVAVSGTGVYPAITTSVSKLGDFGFIDKDSSSVSQSYTISGSYLDSDIIITAPSQFTISLDNSTFVSCDTLIQSGGTVSATTIYVRFSPTSNGTKADTVRHTSAGASEKKVAVSGTCYAPVSGDYRSKASGNWNATATWETFNGTSWITATATPTSTDGTITIRNGHTVTISATGLTYDQVLVAIGGQVTVPATITSTLADGAGTDLIIYGTWLNQGGTWTSTGQWAVMDGGTYIHYTTSGVSTPLGKATLSTNSNFVYRGSSTLTPAISYSGRTYGNLFFESTSGNWSGSLTGTTATSVTDFTIGTGVTTTVTHTALNTVNGSFTNNGTFTPGAGTQQFVFAGSGKTIGGASAIQFETMNIRSGASYTLGRDITIPSTFTATDSGALYCGDYAVTGAGSFTMVAGSALGTKKTTGINDAVTTTGKSFSADACYIYNGTSAQVTGSSLPATIDGLVIDNAAGVTLSQGVTLNDSLVLASSVLATSSNTLTVSATGASLRTSGWVEGTYRKYVTAGGERGSRSCRFELGTNGAYSPDSVVFDTVSTAGYLSCTIAFDNGGYGNAADSLSASKRCWRIIKDNNLAFDTCQVTLWYQDADFNTNCSAGAEDTLKWGCRYNDGTKAFKWDFFPVSRDQTNNSATLSKVTPAKLGTDGADFLFGSGYAVIAGSSWTGIGGQWSAAVPPLLSLSKPYPNPATGRVSFQLGLPQAGAVRLAIYNAIGQRVATPVETLLGAGRHTLQWNLRESSGQAVAVGVYFYRLSAGEKTVTGRIAVIR